MQVEIKIDDSCKEPKIIVVTDRMTDEISAVIKTISNMQPWVLAGFKDETVCLLSSRNLKLDAYVVKPGYGRL